MSVTILPELLTKEEVAPLLRVGPKTVERLILSGELTPTRYCRKVFVRRDVLAAYIDRMTKPACPNGSSTGTATGLPVDQTDVPHSSTAAGTTKAPAETDRSAELHSALRILRRPRTA